MDAPTCLNAHLDCSLTQRRANSPRKQRAVAATSTTLVQIEDLLGKAERALANGKMIDAHAHFVRAMAGATGLPPPGTFAATERRDAIVSVFESVGKRVRR